MPKLLIVDDKAENRYVLINFLRLMGHEVPFDITEGDSAKQCLEILREDKSFDLILLDIKMETDNAGLEVVKTIRNDSQMKDMNVWAITARAMIGGDQQTSDKEMCLNAGYNDYISKPFDPRELLTKVSAYFSIDIPEKVKKKLKMI